MLRIFLVVGLSFYIFSCGSSEKNVPENNSTSSYTIETYSNPSRGWGYRILKEDQPFIDQPHIPAVQGNNGFDTEEKAERAAELVIHKLEQGIMPPTLTVQELDSINVLNE